MPTAPRPPTPFARRLQAWLVVGALLGAQMLAAWHAIAHTHRLKGPAAQASAAAWPVTAVVHAHTVSWGHDDDGSWRCLAWDHALAADGLVSDGALSVPQALAADAFAAPRLQTTRLQAHHYSARAPPKFLV